MPDNAFLAKNLGKISMFQPRFLPRFARFESLGRTVVFQDLSFESDEVEMSLSVNSGHSSGERGFISVKWRFTPISQMGILGLYISAAQFANRL